MQRWQPHFGFSHTGDNSYCYATAGIVGPHRICMVKVLHLSSPDALPAKLLEVVRAQVWAGLTRSRVLDPCCLGLLSGKLIGFLHQLKRRGAKHGNSHSTIAKSGSV